ncbi:outer membrane protein [Rhizobium sp. PAMB 3182]
MKIVLASLMAVSALSAPVAAADLYVPEQAPVYQPAAAPEVTVAAASGWYLRGDVGYSFNELRGVKFFQGGDSSDYASFDKHDLHDNFTAGVGVGYQVNDMFRTDLTFDYLFKSKFRGSTHSSGGATAGTACENACTSTDISSLTAYSLMANAYVDLGTYYSVTPYVGGGIGGTYVKWGDLKNTACDDSGTNGCDDTVTHRGGGGWRFSYALMAGAAVDLTCNLKADIGYRYKHVNGGNMFGYASNGGPGYHKSIDQHEVRAGLRYTFNACNNEVAYVPPVEIPAQPPVYK